MHWIRYQFKFRRQAGLVTEESVSEGNYDRFRGRIHNKGIPAERPTESIHSFPGFSNFKLRVFNNGQEFPGTSGDDINHDSLVFQLSQPPTTAHLHSSL